VSRADPITYVIWIGRQSAVAVSAASFSSVGPGMLPSSRAPSEWRLLAVANTRILRSVRGEPESRSSLLTRASLGEPYRLPVTGHDIRRWHSQIRIVVQSRSFPLIYGGVALGRPAVKVAPLFGAAKRTLDGEDRSKRIELRGERPWRSHRGII